MAFFELSRFPPSATSGQSGDFFDELTPGALSNTSRTDFQFPAALSETEINWSRRQAKPTCPLGYYRINNVFFCGRAYSLRGTQVCYSASTIPDYWRKMLEENPALAPEPSQLIEREISRPAVLFFSRDYNNYGHWWLDIAPRLYSLWRYRPELLKELAIVIPNDLSEWGKDVLCAVYGIDPAAFVTYDPDREALYFRTAVIPTMMHTHYDFHPQADEFYRHVMTTCADPCLAEGRSDLIFLTRRNSAPRAGKKARLIENAAAAEALFESLGFEVVSPEELSWREQVALFANAKVVAGEHGSAMKNLLFASHETIAVVINYLNNTQSTIAALKAQRCLIIGTDGFNPSKLDKPFTVNLKKLEICVEHALQAVAD